MAAGRSVQFYGKDSALTAYVNRDIPAWSLMQGAQFLHKYSGTDIEQGKDELDAFLSSIETGYGGNGHTTYTLNVYEDLPAGTKITNKTPADGSFNFQLVDRLTVHNGRMESQTAQLGALIDERLNARLGAVDENEDEPEPEPKGWDAVLKLLDHPVIKEKIAGYAVSLLDRFLGPSAIPAAVSGAPGVEAEPAKAEVVNPLSQDETEKLNRAIQTLWRADPQIGTHLLKLADVAHTDPEKFKSLISMLNFL